MLGYNDPKKHGHSVKALDTSRIEQMVLQLETELDRKYMDSSQMKLLENMVRSVCDSVSKYLDYTQSQRDRVQEYHTRETPMDPCIEDFKITKIDQTRDSHPYFTRLKTLKDRIQCCDVYDPLEIRNLVNCSRRQNFYNLVNDIKSRGFPLISHDHDLYHYKLQSHGPHPAVHFIWKQPKNDDTSQEHQNMLINGLRVNSETFYNRAGRREVKNCIHRLGVVKPNVAEYMIRTLLNDSSQCNDKSQKAIIERLDRVVSLGEDVIMDLRAHNGRTAKFDDFWNIVQTEINDKTSLDDRRHTYVDDDGSTVVNMALALSYRDLYRTCVEKALSVDIPKPTYPWFMYQFWPSTKTMSRMFNYTGKFKVKRMVQARILRKYNIDSHYANALYSFLKQRACELKERVTMVSSDAKCKVSVGEPGTPIASVKKVIVGLNETFQVADHDFSKISLIPDANFIQSIPEKEDGSWYKGQVYYSIKDMALQGSTA